MAGCGRLPHQRMTVKTERGQSIGNLFSSSWGRCSGFPDAFGMKFDSSPLLRCGTVEVAPWREHRKNNISWAPSSKANGMLTTDSIQTGQHFVFNGERDNLTVPWGNGQSPPVGQRCLKKAQGRAKLKMEQSRPPLFVPSSPWYLVWTVSRQRRGVAEVLQQLTLLLGILYPSIENLRTTKYI